MSKVQNAIQAAASRFAHEVISLLRASTLSDILSITSPGTGAQVEAAVAAAGEAPGSRGRGRRGLHAAPEVLEDEDEAPARRRAPGRKRSREEVQKLADRVLEFVKGTKGDIGVSAIAEALKVPTQELGLPLAKLRANGKVKAFGQKRNTVYRVA